jgi:histidyl-tRNA synthetase
MFRAEQPQRGRYRQFYQAGCEVFGDPGPVCDAEMIDMLVQFLREAGVAEPEVVVSSMGGPTTRERYRTALVAYLQPRAAELSEHSRRRLEVNPLRILDSKDERDRTVIAGAPSILDHLEDDDRRHFDGLRRALDALGTSYTVEPSLVRGFDYYTRTLFEIRSQAGELGAQNALLGGGRYDGMVKSLGGPQVPAIGFAVGLERILLAAGARERQALPFCFIAPIGERAALAGLRLARELRERGARVELDGRGGSLKSMLRRADSSGARLCIVLGDAELDRGVIQLKDLALHAQHDLPLAAAADQIVERLRAVEPAAMHEPPIGGAD